MAREFSGPLTADDLVWLRQRYNTAYVDHQVALLGLADDDTEADADAQAEADAKARAEAEEAAQKAEEARLQAEQAAAAESNGDGGLTPEEEDLLGDEEFDVTGSTESEVKTWAETASDADKAKALATEQAREDRDARKGVVALLS